ncbi:MAG: hypothetical protein AAF226_10745 [Verrucomicrobiota bacterium]
MRNELSVFFSNPATDPLGKQVVEGRLFCGPDYVELQYKVRDRAFKKNDATEIRFDYSEVEMVDFNSPWIGPKILTFQVRETDKLKSFPGAKVGKIELHVTKASRDDAKKAQSFIEYHQSEAYLRERDADLRSSRDDLI